MPSGELRFQPGDFPRLVGDGFAQRRDGAVGVGEDGGGFGGAGGAQDGRDCGGGFAVGPVAGEDVPVGHGVTPSVRLGEGIERPQALRVQPLPVPRRAD